MGTVVNVLGLQRSGTTMLHLMLASGPNAVACGEIGGWFRQVRYREGTTPPERFEPLKHVRAQDFHVKALDHFGVEFIIDATKSLEWVLEVNRFTRNHGIDTYNILIWKSPIDQTYSYWKRGLSNSLPSRYYAWPFYHRRLLRSGLDFFSVKYDELVREPNDKIQRICECIGMPYHEGKEYFWRDEHDIAGSSPGVKSQAERGSSGIELEEHHPDFEPIAQHVRAEVETNEKVRFVLTELKKREISNLNVETCRPHEYDPSVLPRLEHQFWRITKNAYLRFRHNVLEPRYGHTISKLARKLFYQNPDRDLSSFDPDAST